MSGISCLKNTRTVRQLETIRTPSYPSPPLSECRYHPVYIVQLLVIDDNRYRPSHVCATAESAPTEAPAEVNLMKARARDLQSIRTPFCFFRP